MSAASAGEVQTVAAARRLGRAATCFVGVGRPSTAAILARLLYNPDLVIVYESGTIGTKPDRVPLSIGDGELASTADAVVGVPEMFQYWVQGERIELAFLGAAQIDRFCNLNSTIVGKYEQPLVRLPGAGGAPEISSGCEEVAVIVPHTRRTFMERLDFTTTVGHGDGPGARDRLGLRGRGPTVVFTDLGVLEPDPSTCELTLRSVHPGVTVDQAREATGWELAVAPDVGETTPPSDDELLALRELVSR